MGDFAELLSGISDAIWAPMAYVVLGLGVAYSVATKGVQFRRIPDMLRQLRDSEGGEGGQPHEGRGGGAPPGGECLPFESLHDRSCTSPRILMVPGARS